MKLIVGLGNPGSKYTNTRHNVGFMALDYYAKKNNLDFKLKTNFKGEIATFNKHILLKPLTYMNLSGESVRAVANYYNIPISDILVICDDFSLVTGKVRIREAGSSGGHNGLKSINAHLASENYARVKIGIDKNNTIETTDYVLGKFSQDDLAIINLSIEKTSIIIDDFINDISIKQICSTRN